MQRKPYQVSLTAASTAKPLLRTNYHYTVSAELVKGMPLPHHTRACEIACQMAEQDGLLRPQPYAVEKGYR